MFLYMLSFLHEFEDFYPDLNLSLSNINAHNLACFIIIGDFNARSPHWWVLDKENNESRELVYLLPQPVIVN